LAPEALRGSGGILVTSQGKRFVNELGLREHVTNTIFKECSRFNSDVPNSPHVAYLILNNKAVELYQAPALAFYRSKGFIKAFNNSVEAAEYYSMDTATLASTLSDYTKFVTQGADPFGKKTFPVTFSSEEPLHIMAITPAIHYTMGGVKIDESGCVFNQQGTIIPGLFAAGEVTGGVHGGNRLAGNSLLECVVFGRQAAKSAMKA
jgi:cleavage and polyadenylation specificity factor subunit 2